MHDLVKSCSALFSRQRNILFIRIIIGMLFVLLSSVLSNAQGWLYQFVGSDKYLLGVSFTDSSTGTIVGTNGLILRTTDGGANWVPQSSGTTRQLSSVKFTDANHGAVVGDDGTILHTTNGGQTWTLRQYAQGIHLTCLSFADSNYGTAVGYYNTYYQGFPSWPLSFRTTDGGVTWFGGGYFPAIEGDALFGVSFKNREIGVAVGNTNLIYRTIDGGSTWNRISGNTYNYWLSVDLTQNNTGIVVGDQVRSTNDAGLTWSNVFLNNASFRSVSFGDFSHVTAVGVNCLSQSYDGGYNWNNYYPNYNFNAVSSVNANTVVAVGDHGVILRSVGGGYQPPPMLLAYPQNNSLNVPIDFSAQTPFAVTFRWQFYPYTTLRWAAYLLQVSTDSTFTNTVFALNKPLGRDTAMVVSEIFEPNTKYYWRVLVGEANPGYYVTSDTWNFTTAEYPRKTVRDIQYVDQNSLLRADSLHNNGGDQISPYSNQYHFITARCVVPSMKLLNGDYTPLIVCDTETVPSPWHGLFLRIDRWRGELFTKAKRGDIIIAKGEVVENLSSNTNTNTEFWPLEVVVIDSSCNVPLLAVQAHLSDFYKGIYPNGKVKYSTGEQYEGSIVELHHVNVYSILNQAAGTFEMIDGDGNTLSTSDLSPWFTMQSHRDPASTYTIPLLGAVIDTIRGLIFADGGTRYRIAPLNPGDIVMSTQHHALISGTVYQDRNHDGTRSGHEPGIPNWSVDISGRVKGTIYADGNGKFSLGGLDTGTYTITLQPPPSNWVLTPPQNLSRTITIGLNDTSSANDFGNYFPWNLITGRVFYDKNENGTFDLHESGLNGWLVRLNGELDDTVRTDSSGGYEFNGVVPGLTTISIVPPPQWEQIIPLLKGAYSQDIQTFSQIYGGGDFAVHPIPRRIKLTVTVHDNTSFTTINLWWGIRPGTSYGIWGVNPGGKVSDFSEGEFEIPPQTYGLFDARFEDARGGIQRFGYGSWTDMRDFYSSGQVDSFLLTFRPGYIYGGDYPITLIWSKDSVQNSFIGPVTITPSPGQPVDMKQTDSIVISYTDIFTTTIITRQPNFPNSFEKKWNLISLPMIPENGSVNALFSTISGKVFAFSPTVGYLTRDSLVPGAGYWVKYSPPVDPIPMNGASRLLDTLAVGTGWNLIGSLSAPTTTASVQTIPVGILTSSFFSYQHGYQIVDTLVPTRGYWIKTKQAGKIVLDINATALPKYGNMAATVNEVLQHSSRLVLTDADGDVRELFVTTINQQEFDTSKFDLPPIPPEGFDARFISNRLVEAMQKETMQEFPILLQSDKYPIGIRWVPSNAGGRLARNFLSASIKNNNAVLSVEDDNVVMITEPSSDISLLLLWSRELPKEFVLDQNYPNPFNPKTSIRYGIPKNTIVNIKVFDLLGREVKELFDGFKEAGYYEVEWDGTNARSNPVASGLYFYRLSATAFGENSQKHVVTKKMVVLK